MRLISMALAAAVLSSGAAASAPLATSPVQPAALRVAPPPLPLYAQPPVPAPGHLWLPGHWDVDDEAYFWVPGTWAEPPRVGLLWTPGYWACDDGSYAWHGGYWSERVGFYGGVDYGFGYTGDGFYGAEWRGARVFYNRAAANVVSVTTVTDVYTLPVAPNRTVNHVSFNGCPGGLQVRPTPQQIAFGSQPHVAPTAAQQSHWQLARQTPSLREARNHGRPVVAATRRPAEFQGPGVVGARTAGTRPAAQVIPQGRGASDAAIGGASGHGGPRSSQPSAPSPNRFEQMDPTRGATISPSIRP